MPTSRVFAFNTGSTISGTEQYGSIAIGVATNVNYTANYGGVRWFMGPDEELGYVIAQSVPSLDQPNPDNAECGVGFFRTDGFNDNGFIEIVNVISSGMGFFTASTDSYNWLIANGYWTSYNPPTPTPTPSSTVIPTLTPTPTPTPTPSSAGFVNPSLTIGPAVTTNTQSPFTGGGNSYVFSSSVNSYITTPGSDDWAVGTGDFTVEWFSYQTTLTQFQRVFTVGNFPSIKIGVSIESGTFYYWANNSFRYSSSSASSANQWIHWAVVRQSGVTKVYKNGTQLGSQITDTNNITDNTTTFVVGNTNTFATNAALVGYLTNLRWVKGLAVYTGNFTVPTSQLTAVASANPYGGSNTQAITAGFTKLLLVP